MIAFMFRHEHGTDLRVFSTTLGAYRFAAKLMEEYSYDMETFEPSMALAGHATLEDYIAMLDEWNDYATADGMEIVIQEVDIED